MSEVQKEVTAEVVIYELVKNKNHITILNSVHYF